MRPREIKRRERETLYDETMMKTTTRNPTTTATPITMLIWFGSAGRRQIESWTSVQRHSWNTGGHLRWTGTLSRVYPALCP
ncbi:hypothetical protein AMELA_G00112070, partial [Ameiurus melas]